MAANRIPMIAVAVLVIAVAVGVVLFVTTQDVRYPIDYDLDGGEFCADPAESYRSGDKVDLQYPIKDDKAFAGWYTDVDRTVFFDGDTHGFQGPLKLYARWAPSPIGLMVWYNVEGDCDRSMSSYNLSGYRAVYYDTQSTRSGLTHTVTVDILAYDYYEIHDTYISSTQDEGWGPGLGDWAYKGTETIDTISGEKVCEVYVHTYGDSATETRWIDDAGIVYKQYYELVGNEDSDVQSMHITRTYRDHEKATLADEYTVRTYAGIGITVTGNKGIYKPGELVTLTAEVDPGVTFSGWYGPNLRLLSTDTTYVFEPGFDQTVYAMNSLDIVKHYHDDDVIDLSSVFHTPEGTMYSAHLNGNIISTATWNTPTYTGLDSGFYMITARTPSDERLVSLMQIGGLVEHKYSWKWGGDSYSLSLGIDYDDYAYAKKIYDVDERRQSKPDHIRDRTFVTMSYEDVRMKPYLTQLSDSLLDAYMEKHRSLVAKDYLNYLLAFTQNIPYQTDEEYMGYTEYWKFPLETLFDEGGDCEDTAILYAALAHEIMPKLGTEYGIALQIMPGHMSAAVKTDSISGEANPYGYFYGETTALNYKVGDIPSKMRSYFLDSEYYPDKSYTVVI